MSSYESDPLTYTVFDAEGTRVEGEFRGGQFDLESLDAHAAQWVREVGLPQGLVRPVAASAPAVDEKEEA